MILDLFFICAGAVYSTYQGIKRSVRVSEERQYIKNLGFNRERQHQLEMMVDSYDRMEKEAFERLCGYAINRKDSYAKRAAIRSIAEREGWRYYDVRELSKDPTYLKMTGGKIPDWLDDH